MSKKALITGITGQDGSYLAELLLGKGYEVHGVVRRSSSMNRARIDHIQHAHPGHTEGSRFVLHYGDMTDSGGLNRLVKTIRPDEMYNLAAQSHVQISFDQPEYTGDADGLGTTRLLEAIRTMGLPTRFYQASTSEMFGLSPAPQSETTPFHPRVAPPRRELRHAQGHARHRADPRGQGGQAEARQHGRQARLGPRPRLRRSDVADAPAGPGRRLRDRDGRDAFGARLRGRGVRDGQPRLA